MVDQVFCANCAIMWGGTALISNMYNPPRRAETDPTIQWFKDRDFKVWVAPEEAVIQLFSHLVIEQISFAKYRIQKQT